MDLATEAWFKEEAKGIVGGVVEESNKVQGEVIDAET